MWLLFILSLWFYPRTNWGTESVNKYIWQMSQCDLWLHTLCLTGVSLATSWGRKASWWGKVQLRHPFLKIIFIKLWKFYTYIQHILLSPTAPFSSPRDFMSIIIAVVINPLSPVSSDHVCMGIGSPLGHGQYARSHTHKEKWFFPSPVATNCQELLQKGEFLEPPSPFILGFWPIWSCTSLT